MSFFKQVEGEAAVLVENGVYKQVDLYTRDGSLYAKANGGFVRLMADGSTTKAKQRLDFLTFDGPLMADGSTTKAKQRLDFLTFDGPLMRDGLGRLGTADMKGAKALEPAKAQLLLGAPAN